MKTIRGYFSFTLICLAFTLYPSSDAQDTQEHSEDFNKAVSAMKALGKNENMENISDGMAAYKRISDKFKAEVLMKNPEYAELNKEMEEAQKNYNALYNEKLKSDPKFRELIDRQNTAAMQLMKSPEDMEKQKEMQKTANEINKYFKDEHIYRELGKLQKASFKLEQKLIKNSISPIAEEYRLLMKQIEGDYETVKISFADIFKGIKPKFMEADIQKMQAEFIARKLKEENPDIGTEKINAVINAVSGKEKPDEAVKILAQLTDNESGRGFSKIFLVLSEQKRPGRPIHREYLKLFDKTVIDSAVSGNEALLTARLIMQINFRDLYLNLSKNLETAEKADPWLKAFFQGKAELVQAWQSRGGGTVDTVTEDGWKGFEEHQDKARKFLKTAQELHPEYPDAAALMIRVEWGNIPLCVEWFRKALEAQADFSPAYAPLKWTLLPRWGGSLDMLCDFADACIDSQFTASDIPEYGLAAVVTAAQDVEDYRWQALYRRATAEKLLKIFEDKKSRTAVQDEKDHFAVLQVSVLVALREYEKAAALMTEPVKGKLEKLRNSDMATVNLWVDYENTLKVFTGPHKDVFFKIESDFIAGKPGYEKDLLDLIKSGNLSKEEKEFAIDFYGRTKLEDVHVSKLSIYKTALNTAIAQTKDISLIKTLLELGADYNAKTMRGYTAVKLASESEIGPEVLELLKKAGADSHPPDVNRKNPPRAGTGNSSLLNEAIARKDVNEVKKLIAEGTNLKNGVALFVAVKQKSPEIFKLLLDAGADINFQAPQAGVTAFVAALRSNMPREIIEASIKKGADLNAVDKRGVTVLMHAVSACNDPEIISLLLSGGAKVNSGAENKYTPLMVAASLKDGAEKIKILLKAGADVNAQDDKGMTPLMAAVARGGNLESVKLLVEAGAEPGKRNSYGFTALGLAEKNKRDVIAEYLRGRQ